MADRDSMDVGGKGPGNKRPSFALGGEEIALREMENGDVNTENGKGGKSRFKVEFVGAPPRNNDTDKVEEPKTARQRQISSCGSTNSDLTTPPMSPNNVDTYHTHTNYDTSNLKTFGHNTLETLPHLDHYRNLLSATGAMKKRPTLLELHEQDKEDGDIQEIENGHVQTANQYEVTEELKPVVTGPKFGWIKGVLVRCLLNIWGVMLFLRLSWVVGQSGVLLSAGIVLLSGVVTTITALSMAAICTNGEVKGGGAYFMISRSLGPEFGGAIGLIFSVANAVAVAMYVVGFAETIRDILKNNDCLMVDELNDVRIIGAITILVLLGVAVIGMEWEARAQVILLGILLIAIANFIIGTFIPPSEEDKAKGFVGYNATVFKQNLGPDFRDGHGFFSVFSIFFPAATGILAGANISGDLADASRAIPKGTLWAILISTCTYIGMAWMAGAVVLRDASGYVAPAVILAANGTNNASLYVQDLNVDVNGSVIAPNGTCTPGVDCQYGLQNDMQVMQLTSGFGPLIIAGIISATLSSALASLVSAPKVFQAVCKDKIFPGIHVFAKGYGPSEEPRRAYLLAFAIGLAFICIGELNAIAPLISNFFLMSYALINYSCFDASLAKSPGWRPAFRYYSMWMSLLGAVLCLCVMFVINWWTALISFFVVATLYIYVHYQKPDINWGSSTQAHVYRNALQHTLKLVSVMEHVKNFRPQVLVMSGYPSNRPALIDFASSITKNIGLMMCGHVIVKEDCDSMKDMRQTSKLAYAYLHKRKVKSFYTAVTAPTYRQGVQSLLQCCGTGKLRPNTLLIGFKQNWKECKGAELEEYVNTIHDGFDLRYGVGILRVPEGLDHSEIAQENEIHGIDAVQRLDLSPYILPCEYPFYDLMSANPTPKSKAANTNEKSPADINEKSPLHTPSNIGDNNSEDEEQASEDEIPNSPSDPNLLAKGIDQHNKDVLKAINRFTRKQKKGTIDVWWLFDDGGLTLLIPYILLLKKQWEKCKLRVFAAGTKKGELARDQRQMATLLSKFRIDYSSMKVLPDVGKKPSQESNKEFKNLIKDWSLDVEKEREEDFPWKITLNELSTNKDKTNRQLRIRELLLENSRDANLIVLSLPMPKKGLCCPALYMAWIETLTKDMPPILLLRGNQDSVLTYYS